MPDENAGLVRLKKSRPRKPVDDIQLVTAEGPRHSEFLRDRVQFGYHGLVYARTELSGNIKPIVAELI